MRWSRERRGPSTPRAGRPSVASTRPSRITGTGRVVGEATVVLGTEQVRGLADRRDRNTDIEATLGTQSLRSGGSRGREPLPRPHPRRGDPLRRRGHPHRLAGRRHPAGVGPAALSSTPASRLERGGAEPGEPGIAERCRGRAHVVGDERHREPGLRVGPGARSTQPEVAEAEARADGWRRRPGGSRAATSCRCGCSSRGRPTAARPSRPHDPGTGGGRRRARRRWRTPSTARRGTVR